MQRIVNSKNQKTYLSSGSLIHAKVVLTTAHNLLGKDPRKIIVRAGEWNTQSENEICGQEEREVQRVIKHENFVQQDYLNDVELLILKSEFPMTAFINTICLAPPDATFDTERCFSGGWGKDKFGKKGEYQNYLKKVELPILSKSDCQEKLRKTRLGKDYVLPEGFICAGNSNFFLSIWYFYIKN